MPLPSPRDPALTRDTLTGRFGDPARLMRRIDGRVPPDVPPYHTDGRVTEIDPAERQVMWWSGLDLLARPHRLGA